ncbi:MAG: hypothetical protein ACTS5A_02805 [Candidatus Hodgkinia cicadicola]
MLTIANVKSIKLIRKLTGFSISVCKALLVENSWDAELTLSNLPQQSIVTEVSNGYWFVGCVKSRFMIYLFKVYANSDIYNNRYLHLLWSAMNKFTSESSSDKIVLIRKMISEGIMIYACLTFPRLNDTYGLYQHGEISHFVSKTACLIFISSYTCPKRFVFKLAQSVSQHLMCYAICNSNVKLTLSKALNSPFAFNTSVTANEVLLKFTELHQCKVTVQRAFALT